jgi:hypothetical protein
MAERGRLSIAASFRGYVHSIRQDRSKLTLI